MRKGICILFSHDTAQSPPMELLWRRGLRSTSGKDRAGRPEHTPLAAAHQPVPTACSAQAAQDSPNDMDNRLNALAQVALHDAREQGGLSPPPKQQTLSAEHRAELHCMA